MNNYFIECQAGKPVGAGAGAGDVNMVFCDILYIVCLHFHVILIK